MFTKSIFVVTFILNKVTLDNASEESKRYIDREYELSEGYPLDSLPNFTELAAKYGYPSEEHTVVTEDGYILTIFRIVRGKKCQGPIRSPPVLLMHGLLMSSDAWLDSGPESGLAYLISNACYDLWAGNVRGNYYGKRHRTLNPETDIDFWQFTVNEIGSFDMPAVIDYILNYTSSAKINYIGYSQGASTYFIMCSERKGYCDKVQVLIGLGPDSRNTYLKSVFSRLVVEAYQDLYPALTEVGFYEALPRGGIVQQTVAFICQNFVIADTFCRTLLSMIDSPHPGSIETQTLRVLFDHFPAGTSVKNLVWYSQSLNVDDFQHFDYGTRANMELYGSLKPPSFNLSATTTPTVVISGKNDFLTVPADEEWLTSHLPNVLEHYIVQDSLWNHIDIAYSKLTSKDILPKILEYLLKYSDETDV
ncbi:unnamed protein product [Parnassius apollo]|uniref:Lipase n=1 Tax=Parnassius apollo TaxID=110799 RepID=A0A8S3XA05_PARAO|nr:unnamed protein product [Parnassius apollo]